MSNNNTKVNNPMKVITGKDTRWSYANVWEAKSINGGAPKFSVSLIIPKSDTVTVQKIKAAIEAAYHEGEAKLKGNGKSVPALSVIKNAPTSRASSCIGRQLRQTVNSSVRPPRANGSIPMYISRRIRTGRTAPCFRPPPVKAPSVRQAAKSRKTLSPSPVWWAHSAVPTVSPP